MRRVSRLRDARMSFGGGLCVLSGESVSLCLVAAQLVYLSGSQRLGQHARMAGHQAER